MQVFITIRINPSKFLKFQSLYKAESQTESDQISINDFGIDDFVFNRKRRYFDCALDNLDSYAWNFIGEESILECVEEWWSDWEKEILNCMQDAVIRIIESKKSDGVQKEDSESKVSARLEKYDYLRLCFTLSFSSSEENRYKALNKARESIEFLLKEMITPMKERGLLSSDIEWSKKEDEYISGVFRLAGYVTYEDHLYSDDCLLALFKDGLFFWRHMPSGEIPMLIEGDLCAVALTNCPTYDHEVRDYVIVISALEEKETPGKELDYSNIFKFIFEASTGKNLKWPIEPWRKPVVLTELDQTEHEISLIIKDKQPGLSFQSSGNRKYQHTVEQKFNHPGLDEIFAIVDDIYELPFKEIELVEYY